MKEKATGAVGGGVLDLLGEVLGSIDAFDQLAELLKTVVPMKAEITVKGKKAVEVRAYIKDGVFWIGFKRIKEKPVEPVKEEEESEGSPETS